MNRFLQDTMRDVESNVLGGAHKAFWQLLPALTGYLIGLVGFGFLTASAFLALRTSLGAGWATLAVGGALMLLAVGLLVFTKTRPIKSVSSDAKEPAAAPETEASNAAPMFAFTAAFVLARYLADDSRD